MIKRALLGLLLTLVAFPAIGQTPPQPAPVSIIANQSVSLSATATSTNVALPSTNVNMIAVAVYNSGLKDALIKLGGATVTASTTDLRVPAGKTLEMFKGSSSYVSAITVTPDTTTLYIYQGNGPIDLH